MLLEGKVGVQNIVDGSLTAPRLGRLGELMTNDTVGKYYELSRRGQIFMAAMQAGASLGTALTVTAVTLSLYNPLSSGVDVALLQCTVLPTNVPQTTTATYEAFAYAVNMGPIITAPASNTAAIIVPGLLNVNGSIAAGTGGGIARCYRATTLPDTPIIARWHPMSFSNMLTTNNMTGGGIGIDNIDGALVLGQGTIVTLQGIATTTATTGVVSFVWAEIPI